MKDGEKIDLDEGKVQFSIVDKLTIFPEKLYKALPAEQFLQCVSVKNEASREFLGKERLRKLGETSSYPRLLVTPKKEAI